MNGHKIRIAYEKYGISALSRYMGINETMIRHITEEDPTNKVDVDFKGIKFDVKYASPTVVSHVKKQNVWDFDLRNKGRKGKYCDFYILIGIKNGIPQKVFLVPFDKAPSRHLRISIHGGSKYHRYEIKRP